MAAVSSRSAGHPGPASPQPSPRRFLSAPLPPLQTMESLLFEMITVGFILLSMGLLSGFMFLEKHVLPARCTQDRTFYHLLAGLQHPIVGKISIRLARTHRHSLDVYLVSQY